jgi:galactokinase/mevalonate kinase-like predicted kinase
MAAAARKHTLIPYPCIGRRGKNIAEQFKEEEEKSMQFMEKLTQIKKSNKESKERTVINQHKLEWFKTFRQNQKRE